MDYDFKSCSLCPRNCRADRTRSTGKCKMSDRIKAAKAYLHKWEEPCIAGKNGAGTIFFSGCSLGCVFCQNAKISAEGYGKEISEERLSEIMLDLQSRGADCIELVSPTHFVPQIISALDICKEKLRIPVVYNCGGYEKTETLKMLEGYVDIYLPDLKYMDSTLSGKYSAAPDYFEYASRAVKEMCRQTGKIICDSDGFMKRGVIIRHLILPGGRHDSVNILNFLAKALPRDNFLLSLMSQYVPMYKAKEIREINRRISGFEYNYVLDEAVKLGLCGFMQDRSSADENFTPEFDLFGI